MKEKYLIRAFLFLGLLTIPFSLFSQGNGSLSITDSLALLIKSDLEDTNKINHLNDMGWQLMYQNPDTAIILGQQALQLAINISAGTEATTNPTIKNAAQKNISKAYGNLGVFYYLKGDYSISLDYHFKSLELREAQNDKNGLANSLNNIGLVYRFQGDHANALEYYFKALKLNVELGNKKRIAFNLNNIGLVYYDQGDYKQALDYYFKTLALSQELGNKNIVAENFNNIGIVYYSKGDYPKALKYYFKALKVNEELGNHTEMANNYANIGIAFDKEGDYVEALEYYTKALNMNEELGNKYGIALSHGNIGTVYMHKKNYKEAEIHLLTALKIGEEIGALEIIKDNNQTLSTVYSQTKRFELAYLHYEQYSVAKDSLFNDDKSKEIGRIEMRHEIEKVERDRKLKEEEEIRIAKYNTERKHLLQYSGMFIGLLGIGLVIIMIGFVKVSPPLARSVTFFAILLLFEFVLVLLDPYVERYSSGEPLYKLLINALLAACIFPINALLERVIQKRLMK